MITTDALERMYHAMRSAYPDRLTQSGLSKLAPSAYVERGQIFILNADASPRWPTFEIVPPLVVLHPLDLEELRTVFARDPQWRLNVDQAIADACCDIVAAEAIKDGTFVRWPAAWKRPINRGPMPFLVDCQS